KTTINIFGYRDYRAYLKDWFARAKETQRGFSHRYFCKQAGFNTSNFLMLVMSGKRNLTDHSVTRVVKGLGLGRQEEEFFRNLVYFNQSRTNDEQSLYFERLLQCKKFTEATPIEAKQYEYYSAWYHPVIRELVCSADFDGTPEWLAKRLYPTVSPQLCKKSMEILLELGFIKKKGRGYEQSSAIVSTGAELTSVIVHNYHKSILELSKAVMDKLSTKDRDVSTLTLGVKKNRIAQIRARIKDFRKEILGMVSADTEPDEVVQLNMQFYPVTRKG
ncbi:MAG TPA: TIGR02147 family protein, partial [bacterium]|nr:TIGR02147 family protein [bacterium]